MQSQNPHNGLSAQTGWLEQCYTLLYWQVKCSCPSMGEEEPRLCTEEQEEALLTVLLTYQYTYLLTLLLPYQHISY